MSKGQYNLVDMHGRRCGRLTVERRAANVHGNARWLCRCDCGAEVIVDGIRLRNEDKRFKEGKRSYPICCPSCRPTKPATVRRLGPTVGTHGYRIVR
jgi:hypothetical protein